MAKKQKIYHAKVIYTMTACFEDYLKSSSKQKARRRLKTLTKITDMLDYVEEGHITKIEIKEVNPNQIDKDLV